MSSISDTIGDDRLLGPYFAGDSWARWRAVLKACHGERPASTRERDLFSEVARARMAECAG